MQSRGLVLLIFVEIAQGWKAEGGGWEGWGWGWGLSASLQLAAGLEAFCGSRHCCSGELSACDVGAAGGYPELLGFVVGSAFGNTSPRSRLSSGGM